MKCQSEKALGYLADMENNSNSTAELRCSFCGRSSGEVSSIIAGPNVNICVVCVQNASDILRKNARQHLHDKASGSLPPPSQIKSILDSYVIGQDHAKKVLAVAVYNHYKRIQAQDLLGPLDDVDIEKSNILIVGPTGTGKTLLAKTLAKILDVPFAIADATTLTEAGYVGDDVESIIVNLLQNADYSVERAERGIIYIDEVDKISRKSDSASITRDVSGEGVQQGLLKMLEGTVAAVPPRGGRKHPEAPMLHVNTKNILFICGGAFDGLEKVIAKRLKNTVMGFTTDTGNHVEESYELLIHTEPEDLRKFGFIPELIGRLPIVAPLHPLTDEALLDILTEPRNALVKQYQKLFHMEGTEIEFDAGALQAIVEKAKQRKTGARGLRSIMEETMLPIMYSIPDRTDIRSVRITEDVVKMKTEPMYELIAGTKRQKRA